MDFQTVSSNTSVRKSYAETYKSFHQFFTPICEKRRSATICSKWYFFCPASIGATATNSLSWLKREQIFPMDFSWLAVVYIAYTIQSVGRHVVRIVHLSKGPIVSWAPIAARHQTSIFPMATAWIKYYRTMCRHLNGSKLHFDFSIRSHSHDFTLHIFESQYQSTNKFFNGWIKMPQIGLIQLTMSMPLVHLQRIFLGVPFMRWWGVYI